MDYKTKLAIGQSAIQKDMDYSDIMVAELQSGWSISYQQEESNFVADKWFPMVNVDRIAGYYPKWAKANAFTNKAGTWRPGTLPPAGDLGIDDPGFFACIRYAFQTQLLADLPFVADPAYPLEKATTQYVTDVLRLNKEIDQQSNDDQKYYPHKHPSISKSVMHHVPPATGTLRAIVTSTGA